jgi:hypothetical protein
VPLLCRATFVGPAHLSVTAWTATDFNQSIARLRQRHGPARRRPDGAGGIHAAGALVNREPVYVVFAAWLIVSTRLGAISAGWDALWLGHQVPTGWLDGMRKMVLASELPADSLISSCGCSRPT